MKSAFLHATALCAALVLAQSFTAGDRAQPTLPVVASTSVSAGYFPFTISPETALNADINTKEFFQIASSTWNTTMTVVDAGSSSYQSYLSLSYPAADGPGANNTANWGICAVALPGLLPFLNNTSPTDRSCDKILNTACLHFLLVNLGGIFQDSLTNRDGSSTEIAGNVTAACAMLADVAVPPFCFSGHEGEDGQPTPFQGYSVLNPKNGRPFVMGSDKKKDAALKRVWPLVVVEFAGNETMLTVMTCPTAETSVHENNKTDKTEQDKPNKNDAQASRLPTVLSLAGLACLVSSL